MSEEAITRNGVVYLLGAGASANALPVVNEMKIRIKVFHECLLILEKELSLDIESSGRFNKLKESLQKVIDKIEYKDSIDKYAKQLYLTNPGQRNNELDELKAILSVYLIFEELVTDTSIRDSFNKILNVNSFLDIANLAKLYSGTTGLDEVFEDNVGVFSKYYSSKYVLPVMNYVFDYNQNGYKNNKSKLDSRYPTFLLEIFKEAKFPSNIKIFSWNYDTQLTLALDSINQRKILSEKKVFEMKLNGEAAHKEINPVLNINNNMVEVLDECMDLYWRLMSENWDNDFSKDNLRVKFAFEDGLGAVDCTNFLSNISEIKVLIIIGYSFPAFNREVDRQIFKEIIEKSVNPNGIYKGLRIFIQTPVSDYQTVKDEIEEIIMTINPAFKKNEQGMVISLYPDDVRVINITHKPTESFYVPHNV